MLLDSHVGECYRQLECPGHEVRGWALKVQKALGKVPAHIKLRLLRRGDGDAISWFDSRHPNRIFFLLSMVEALEDAEAGFGSQLSHG
jgi:hypothetical protein